MIADKIANILNAMTTVFHEHARAIELLGKVHGLEWNKETQQWEQMKSWTPIEKETADG